MDNFDANLIKKYVPIEKQKRALKKLSKGYPVQYIIGNVDFYGQIIKVNKHVLIPRFETELLISKTIEYIKKRNFIKPNILEIGTGSGCISILLKQLIDCNITAIDKSKNALKIAKENGKDLDINFICKSIEKFYSNQKFDVLISNPPYVSFNETTDEKIKYEPQMAIFAKDNGLYFYKIILKKSTLILKPKNIIAFEIGQYQAKEIKNIAKFYYPLSKVLIEKDLNNKDRYLFIINE